MARPYHASISTERLPAQCAACTATGNPRAPTVQITPLVLSSGTSGSTPMAEPTTPVRSVTQPASLLIPGVLCAKPPQPAQINEMRQRMRTGEVFRTEILPSAADCPSRKVPNHRSRGIVASPCKTHSTHQFRLTEGTHTFAQRIHFRGRNLLFEKATQKTDCSADCF